MEQEDFSCLLSMKELITLKEILILSLFFFLHLTHNYPVLQLPIILWYYFPQRIAKAHQVNLTCMMNYLTLIHKHLTSQVPGDVTSLIWSLDVISERLHSHVSANLRCERDEH